jgi:hypothetical protein
MVDILNAVLTAGLPRWKPPVLKRSVTAPIPPMSFSTFWPVNMNPLHRQHHDAGTLRRTPIASSQTTEPGPDEPRKRQQLEINILTDSSL